MALAVSANVLNRRGAYGAGFFFSSRSRHTRLTCDWSSDVCSSDLTRVKLTIEVPFSELKASLDKAYREVSKQVRIPGFRRSEERRVGKECRSRWWPEHRKTTLGNASNFSVPGVIARTLTTTSETSR